jgi:hypothetical protein
VLVAPVIFVLFIFYSGLGLITPSDDTDSLLMSIPLYFGFLYIAFSRTTSNVKDTLLLSVAVFALQFVLSFAFPGMTGYPGWLFFALILGRFLGVYHPPVLYEMPLSTGRKVLGWLSLLVFIISFSPRPFIFAGG